MIIGKGMVNLKYSFRSCISVVLDLKAYANVQTDLLTNVGTAQLTLPLRARQSSLVMTQLW